MGKRLVLCCDGTWNRPDQECDGSPCPSNVVKMAATAAKKNSCKRLSGPGTRSRTAETSSKSAPDACGLACTTV